MCNREKCPPWKSVPTNPKAKQIFCQKQKKQNYNKHNFRKKLPYIQLYTFNLNQIPRKKMQRFLKYHSLICIKLFWKIYMYMEILFFCLPKGKLFLLSEDVLNLENSLIS